MRNLKRIVGALLVLVMIIGTVSVFAIERKRTAELLYSDIKILLNGHEIVPRDTNGHIIEPFIINGTTYLPVRGIASALELSVGWDDKTQTVVLKSERTAESPFTLSAGQYIVGEDIEEGKYDCKAVFGSGNFMGDVESLGLMGLNEILAEPNNAFYGNSTTYDNLRLKEGDSIIIGGDLKVEFSIN